MHYFVMDYDVFGKIDFFNLIVDFFGTGDGSLIGAGAGAGEEGATVDGAGLTGSSGSSSTTIIQTSS